MGKDVVMVTPNWFFLQFQTILDEWLPLSCTQHWPRLLLAQAFPDEHSVGLALAKEGDLVVSFLGHDVRVLDHV